MRRLFLLFLVIALAWGPAASSAASKEKKASPADRYETLTLLIFGGQYQRALDILQELKGQKSKGAWLPRLEFLKAFLQLRSGQYDKAIAGFGAIDLKETPIPDYVQFYLSQALREGGKPAEAIALLEKLKGEPISPFLAKKLDRELALAYCKAKDRAQAIDRINNLIQTETFEIKTYHLRYDRARCLMDLGDKDEAFSLLRSLYLSYPEGDLGPSIFKSMEAIRPGAALSAADHVARADQLLSRDRADLAVVDLEAAQALESSPTWDLKVKLAEAYFKARRYPQAAQALEELRRSSPLNDEDLENLAKAYSRSDQFDRAIQVYQELLAAGGDAKAPAFLYKIAFLTMDKGDYGEAKKKFADLLVQFPNHPQKDRIYWYLAWNHYLLKEWEAALGYLDTLEGSAPKFLTAKGIDYWRARIYEHQGKRAEAQGLFRQIQGADPVSYYGFLSAKRLESSAGPDSPPHHSGAGLPQQRIPPPLFAAPTESAGKNTASRLKELLWVGLWEDFLGELAFATEKEGAPSEFRELSAVLASQSDATAQESGNQRERYPPAYATLVALFSRTRQISPALTWAIMREESRFRPGVVSPAKAIGLMQIIPPTGFEIAGDLGRQGFTPDDLYNPVVNIEYGVHYLAKNLDRFQNNMIFTIASYNAGPEAVERWHKARPGREWDEFVEEIPYAETNNYVKKVLKSYYVYSLMYR